jgi:hypothetical protein
MARLRVPDNVMAGLLELIRQLLQQVPGAHEMAKAALPDQRALSRLAKALSS